MARYTGPKHKLARREGVNILDKTSASLLRRLAIPPGVHGRKRRRKLSEYGEQLREKQKLKATYGIQERQLVRLVEDVSKKKGETGELLIGALETRLDNIVYRLGLAKTRFQSRQFVSHGHVLVNGKKVTIPSYQVKEGDTITLKPKVAQNAAVVSTEEEIEVVPYLQKSKLGGTLVRLPKREDVQVLFDTRLIVEYYSR